jgi:hypothetical protein
VKRIILLASLMVMLVLVGLPVMAQDDGEDCDPELLGEWLLARQAHMNQVNHMFSGDGDFTYREGVLDLFRVIQELDTMERPVCADDLYLFTRKTLQGIFEYSSIYYATFDESILQAADTRLDEISEYNSANSGSYIEPLETIAGFDASEQPLDIALVNAVDVRPPLLEFGDTMTVDSDIYGPYDMPPGFYVVTFMADTGAGLDIDPIRGNCRLNMGSGYDGDPVDERESLETNECRFVIDVEQASQSDAAEINWTLTLERID